RSLAVSLFDLFEDLWRSPAGCAVLLQALEQLAFGGKESFEKLAQLLGRRLLFTGRLQRLAVLADLVANGQKLLAGRRRLLPRAEGTSGGDQARAGRRPPGRAGHAGRAPKLRRDRPWRHRCERQRQRRSPDAPHNVVSPPAADSPPPIRGPGIKSPVNP